LGLGYANYRWGTVFEVRIAKKPVSTLLEEKFLDAAYVNKQARFRQKKLGLTLF
jgi:hypothetical protein